MTVARVGGAAAVAGRVLCAEGEKLLRAAESAVDAVRAAGTTEEPM